MNDPIEQLMAQLLAPPRPGVLAADLTDREKLVLANGAGVPVEVRVEGGMMTLVSLVPFAVADRPGGGYIITRRQ